MATYNTESQWELRYGYQLLCKCSRAPNDSYCNLHVWIYEFRRSRNAGGGLDGTAKLLKFIRNSKTVQSLNIIGVCLQYPEIKLVLKLVRAYHNSASTKPKHLAIEFNRFKAEQQPRLQSILADDLIRNTITKLTFKGYSSELSSDLQEALGKLPKLQTFCIHFTRLIEVPFYDSMVDIDFSPTLQKLTTYNVSGKEHELMILRFLQKHPQAESLVVYNPMHTELLLTAITKNDGYGLKLKAFELAGSSRSVFSSATFLANLLKTLSNLSPDLRSLSLNVSLQRNAFVLLERQLIPAIDSNRSVLGLHNFSFKVYSIEGSGLDKICNAFATKKMIEKATNGECPLPVAALPRALAVLERRNGVISNQHSASLIYHAIQNDTDLQDRICQNRFSVQNIRKRKTSARCGSIMAK